MGSRFARLEDIEEPEKEEMETEGRVEIRASGRVIDSRVKSSASVGKGKQFKESGKSIELVKVVVLRASHLGLVEGLKTVQPVGNLNGQGGLVKKKGRVLRDVTNNLEEGPVSRKPSQGRPCAASKNLSRKEAVINNTTHEIRAHVVESNRCEAAVGKASGSGACIGPHSARPPDRTRREDKKESSEQPQIVQATEDGGEGRLREGVSNERM